MKTLTLSDELAGMLDDLDGPLEIRDRSEVIVGTVTPAVVKAKAKTNGQSGWSAAELEEAERALEYGARGYSLKEVWERIYAAHDRLIAALRPLAERTELRGGNGQVIGVFTPGERQ